MADNQTPAGENTAKDSKPEGSGPSETPVGWLGIIGLTAYLVSLALFLGANLVTHWPTKPCSSDPVAGTPPTSVTLPASTTTTTSTTTSTTTPTSTTTTAPPPTTTSTLPSNGRQDSGGDSGACVALLGRPVAYGSEGRLLLIVVFAGALGGVLHALRSLYWYVGNREFRQSWTLSYLLLPWTGSIVGLLIYFLLRAGLLSGPTSLENTNVFGIAAIGSLAGLFSQQAVLKLKEVFETLWTSPQGGKNSVPQGAAPPPKPAPPTVTAVASPTSGPAAQKLSLRGTGFKKPLTVTLTPPGSNQGTTVPVDAVELTSDTACEVTAIIPTAGDWTIVVRNGEGQASAPFKFTAK